MSARTGVVGVMGVAALLVSTSVLAAGTAVVAVDACEAGNTASAAELLRGSLEHSSPGVLGQDELVKHLGGAPRGSLADAERLLASARFDFLDQSAYDRAERTLLGVTDDLRALPPSDARWQDLRDAQTLLAFLYVRQNKKDASEPLLQKLLDADPKLQPSTDLYPPSFRAMVDDLRKKEAKRSTATLKITTSPAGKPVYVEGHGVGNAPITVKLPPGRYRVEADFGTGGSAPRFVEVGESATAELSKDFEGQIFPARGPCIGTDGTREGRLSALVRLAGVLDADEIVGVRVEEPAAGERFVVATAVDAHSAQESREGKVKVHAGSPDAASMQRLAEFLSTGSAVPPVVVTSGGKAAAPEPPKPALTEPPTTPTPSAGGNAPPAVSSATDASVTKSGVSGGSSGLRTASYVVGAASIVSLAGSAFFFGQAAATQKRIDDSAILKDGKVSYPEETGPLLNQVGTEQTTAYVLGGVGVAGVATAVVLFVVGGDTEAHPVAGVTIAPTANGLRASF